MTQRVNDYTQQPVCVISFNGHTRKNSGPGSQGGCQTTGMSLRPALEHWSLRVPPCPCRTLSIAELNAKGRNTAPDNCTRSAQASSWGAALELCHAATQRHHEPASAAVCEYVNLLYYSKARMPSNASFTTPLPSERNRRSLCSAMPRVFPAATYSSTTSALQQSSPIRRHTNPERGEGGTHGFRVLSWSSLFTVAFMPLKE